MKAKIVLILIICGAALLMAATFGIYFARGGQVIYPHYYYESINGTCLPMTSDQNVAEEIAKLNFVFYPSEELKAEFFGYTVIPQKSTSPETGEIEVDGYQVNATVSLEGWVDRVFPSGVNFVSIDEKEFHDTLIKEIQSRITPEAEFRLGHPSFWGEEYNDLKKWPTEEP